jgi:acyl carrier protein
MNSVIRELITAHAGLPMAVAELSDDADLYRAGMKSFASVQLMLALEETFEIEFPEAMLTRDTFRSIGSIQGALQSLSASELAA